MPKIFKNTIIILAVGIVGIIGMVQLSYFPKIREVKELRQSLKTNRMRNQRLKDLANKSTFFDDLNKKIESHHNSIREYLPKEVKLSSILKELSLLASRNNVNVLSIKPTETSTSGKSEADSSTGVLDQFAKSTIMIIMEGDYVDIGTYVKGIEDSNLTVMAIKDFSVRLDEKLKNTSSLKVILTIEAYYKMV